MSAAVDQRGALRARWVPCDAALGRAPSRLDRLDRRGPWSFAAVPHAPQVWRQRPATAGPAWSGPGRPPPRTRVLRGEAAPDPVAQRAASRPGDRWGRRTSKEGSTGPLVARVAALRGMGMRAGVPGPEVWPVLRGNLWTGAWKTSLSHAAAAPPGPPGAAAWEALADREVRRGRQARPGEGRV
jgi:hypothetical protein